MVISKTDPETSCALRGLFILLNGLRKGMMTYLRRTKEYCTAAGRSSAPFLSRFQSPRLLSPPPVDRPPSGRTRGGPPPVPDPSRPDRVAASWEGRATASPHSHSRGRRDGPGRGHSGDPRTSPAAGPSSSAPATANGSTIGVTTSATKVCMMLLSGRILLDLKVCMMRFPGRNYWAR